MRNPAAKEKFLTEEYFNFKLIIGDE